MTHRTDGVSLAFGMVFLGLAGLWVASRVVSVNIVTFGWFVVGMLLLLGVLGIAGSLVAATRRGDDPGGAGPESRHADNLER